MTVKKAAIDFFMHTPAESTSRYVQWVEARQGAQAIDYGCVLDKYLIPLHPGDLMAVVARPGHGKSSFMAYMARRTAGAIAAKNDTDKCVIYVSWEQPVEEIEAFFQSGETYSSTDLAWGRVPLDTVIGQSIKRINMPIWMIGYSMADADQRKPKMTVDVVFDAIRQIRYEFKMEPMLVCLDYLQIIPVNGKARRVDQVHEATIQAKHLAMDLGVPIIGGVQARRQADEKRFQIPSMADAQWSSTIEQTADKQVSLLRPIKTMDEDEDIDIGGYSCRVSENLLIIKLLKQRLEKGYGIWPVVFEPETLRMADYTKIKDSLGGHI